MLFALLFALTVPTLSVLATNSDSRCTPGYYGPSGKSPCSRCPAGSYSKENGQSSCIKARPGYYIPSAGATQETACPRGKYVSASGATSCLSCPAGFMCPSTAMHTPQQCSPGRYSTGGAIDCPKCAAGSFNNIHQATGCCLCPAGWFLAVPGNVNCQKCPNQSPYSLPGASAMNQCSSKPFLHTPSTTSNQGPGGTCPSSSPLPTHKPTRRLISPRLFCPVGHKACPVYNGAKVIDHDCVDIKNNLESCGGCVSFSVNGAPTSDGGRDCSAIPFVNDVRCRKAKCQIGSCEAGYVVSATGDACVPAL